MLCYKDMTFCDRSDCKNFGPCPRSLTGDVEQDAAAWWGDWDAPIAVYVGPPSCFEPKEEETDDV